MVRFISSIISPGERDQRCRLNGPAVALLLAVLLAGGGLASAQAGGDNDGSGDDDLRASDNAGAGAGDHAAGGGEIPLPGGLAPAGSAPGPRIAISGYLENTFSGEKLRLEGTTATVDNTRLRIDLEAELGGGLELGATAVGYVNTGTREVDLVSYLPRADRDRVLPFLRPALFYAFKANDTFLQEAFVGYSSGDLLLRVGRHKVYSGTGYAYNPIDLFNRKDPLDPTYEIDGIDAALVELQVPGGGVVEALLRHDDDHDTDDLQLRYEAHIEGWDMAVQATRHTRWRVDYQALAEGQLLDTFERRFRWRMAAVEAAGELGGIGLHGEAGYAVIEEPADVGHLDAAGTDHLRALVGADYTFESQLMVIAEYLYIGQGRSRPEDLTFNDRLAYLAGETLAPGRETLFAGASYPVTDLTDLSLYGIVDLGTPSALLNPWLVWSALSNLTVSFSATIPVGDRRGPNGEAGPGGFVRLRYSF